MRSCGCSKRLYDMQKEPSILLWILGEPWTKNRVQSCAYLEQINLQLLLKWQFRFSFINISSKFPWQFSIKFSFCHFFWKSKFQFLRSFMWNTKASSRQSLQILLYYFSIYFWWFWMEIWNFKRIYYKILLFNLNRDDKSPVER